MAGAVTGGAGTGADVEFVARLLDVVVDPLLGRVAATTAIELLGTHTSRRTRAHPSRSSRTRTPAPPRKLPKMRPCSEGVSRIRRFTVPRIVTGNESRAAPNLDPSTQAVSVTDVNPLRVAPVVQVVPVRN